MTNVNLSHHIIRSQSIVAVAPCSAVCVSLAHIFELVSGISMLHDFGFSFPVTPQGLPDLNTALICCSSPIAVEGIFHSKGQLGLANLVSPSKDARISRSTHAYLAVTEFVTLLATFLLTKG